MPAQRGADQVCVARGVVCEAAFELRRQRRAGIGKAPVEVLSRLHVETAHVRAEPMLIQPGGIRYRHEHDPRVEQPCGFELGEAALEHPRDDHAGQLVGMQRCLDVDLRRGVVGRSERITPDRAPGTERGSDERMIVNLHGA